MNSIDDTSEVLAGHYLFAPLDGPRLRRLAETARRLELRAGEALFQRGDPASRFFLVEQGQIKLFRVSAAGQEKVVEIMGPGDTFAEAVMFMGTNRYPVNAAAVEPTVLHGIANATYLDILREDAEACLKLLGDLSQRLHRRLNEIDTLTLQRANDRVVRFLVERLPETGPPVIELPAAKHIVASRLAIQPETFSRILLQLSQAGAIEVQGREIRVLDAGTLRDQMPD
ncbi:Crp/Fnr family transcriptional regulator [Ectothiorhodospiraceae bacterium WFHF3C12]|nr:Crp/Fnr family transcriptional regulator [Ectothiorhodospiraceae bacterium WFHF3C12]